MLDEPTHGCVIELLKLDESEMPGALCNLNRGPGDDAAIVRLALGL